MLRVVLIDDETEARRNLRQLLSQFCPSVEIVGDDDGDGICNADDNCLNVASQLTPTPLSHSAPGSSRTPALDFAGNHTDISFKISGINQRTNGNPSRKFIDKVELVVNGVTIETYYGTGPSSVDVTIANADSIRVILSDEYDGDVQSGSISIDFSDVSSCSPSGSEAAPGNWTDEVQTFNDPDMDVRLYPNPTTGNAYIEFSEAPEEGHITVRDILGRTITQQTVWGDRIVEIDIANSSAQQILFVTVEVEGKPLRTLKLIIVE